MAGDQNGEAEGTQSGRSKGGSGKILMIMLLVNMAGLLGLGGFVALSKGSPDPPPTPDELVEEAMDDSNLPPVRRSKGEAGPMVELRPLVVNLREPSGDRYLKTKIHLELDSEESRSEVESRLSQIRYQLTMLLAGQRVADVQGPENMEALRKGMVRRANAVLNRSRINGVWPGEWIVQ